MTTNLQSLVPRTTKMAKYLQALGQNRHQLTGRHMSVLAVLREMNTTTAIIAGLTGIRSNKVHVLIQDLARMGLASGVEERKTPVGGNMKKLWGMHDEFRAVHKVPTYPSAHQELALYQAGKKGGRSLDMDETAAILWGNPEATVRGRSETLVEIASTLKKTPIESRAAGDAAARRENTVEQSAPVWDINDYVGDEEE